MRVVLTSVSQQFFAGLLSPGLYTIKFCTWIQTTRCSTENLFPRQLAEGHGGHIPHPFIVYSLHPNIGMHILLLFSIHFLMYWQGEFVEQSRAYLVGDHSLYSRDFHVWFRADIVGRIYMLVIPKYYSVKRTLLSMMFVSPQFLIFSRLSSQLLILCTLAWKILYHQK